MAALGLCWCWQSSSFIVRAAGVCALVSPFVVCIRQWWWWVYAGVGGRHLLVIWLAGVRALANPFVVCIQQWQCWVYAGVGGCCHCSSGWLGFALLLARLLFVFGSGGAGFMLVLAVIVVRWLLCLSRTWCVVVHRVLLPEWSRMKGAPFVGCWGCCGGSAGHLVPCIGETFIPPNGCVGMSGNSIGHDGLHAACGHFSCFCKLSKDGVLASKI